MMNNEINTLIEATMQGDFRPAALITALEETAALREQNDLLHQINTELDKRIVSLKKKHHEQFEAKWNEMGENQALRAEVERLRTALDEYDNFVKSISWREVYMGYRCMQGTITYDAQTFEGVMGDLAKAREALGRHV